MVLRGLQGELHLKKNLYIISDTAREARDINPRQLFGRFCDPVEPNGEPIKRIFAAYTIAMKYGKELDFAEEFASAIWGRGKNVSKIL